MKIQSIKGMKDMLPSEAAAWQFLEDTARDLLQGYGYREIRTPILEKTNLFKRSIGEVTDIVEKEMYTFEDRNGDSLTMRPELTASVVRSCIQQGLLHNQTQRLWYRGPMFRHERPQKGRYRQFHQIGAEAFGFDGPNIDAELIIMSARLWKKLGLNPSLEINSIGTSETRNKYRAALVEYFTPFESELDADSQRRLTRNPMRILDSKDKNTQKLVKDAPKLSDYLSEEEQSHFDGLQTFLTDAGIEYHINPRLVRGLDYYSLTVFEWLTDQLGAQNAICSGGRYDGLVEQLGGKSTTGVGWAMGEERVVELLQLNNCPIPELKPDIYFAILDSEYEHKAFQLAEEIRDKINQVKLTVDCAGGKLKAQMKRADKVGAKITLMLGEGEMQNQTLVVKPMQGGEQVEVKWAELVPHIKNILIN